MTSSIARIARRTVLVAIAATEVGAQAPRMPWVRPEPCDGYCNKVWASCTRVGLRASPEESARVVATVDSGQLVDVIGGERRTTKPGVVVVRRPHTLVQRLSGPDSEYTPPRPKRWQLRPGDTMYVVDKDTDGDSYVNYVWTYRGREDTTLAFWDEAYRRSTDRAVNTQLVAEMQQAWWARVRSASGQVGWTRHGPEWTGTSHYDEPISRCVKSAKPN
jgi:hypothetical protein